MKVYTDAEFVFEGGFDIQEAVSLCRKTALYSEMCRRTKTAIYTFKDGSRLLFANDAFKVIK